MSNVAMFLNSAVICLILAYIVAQLDADVQKSNSSAKKVTLLVLARGGSKGIPLKNIAGIGNETLLGRTLRIVKETGGWDGVWVSTDHQAIAEEAKRGGALVHFRSPESATDTATSLFAVSEFLDAHKEVEYVALVQCTSPFLISSYLKSALEQAQAGKPCVFSVTRSHILRWRESAEGGGITPLNFDPSRRPRRQDWAGELCENGMFYFAGRELVLKAGAFQNYRCGWVEVPARDSLEIDTIEDLRLANWLLAQKIQEDENRE